MDNALIIDVVLGVLLVAGAVIGAYRGLFKSLMGFLVVLAALVGAVLLADLLTEPLTGLIAPQVEDAVVKRFSDKLEQTAKEDGTADSRNELSELLEKYGLPADTLDELTGTLAGALSDAASAAKGKAADTFRSAISSTVRTLVRGVVHAALVLVLYVVLLIVLKLLTNAIDHVFDLPGLNTLNTLGGAALGLLEAALLLYVVIFAASRFGVKLIAEHADDTYLLAFFLNHSPVEWISALFHKA